MFRFDDVIQSALMSIPGGFGVTAEDQETSNVEGEIETGEDKEDEVYVEGEIETGEDKEDEVLLATDNPSEREHDHGTQNSLAPLSTSRDPASPFVEVANTSGLDIEKNSNRETKNETSVSSSTEQSNAEDLGVSLHGQLCKRRRRNYLSWKNKKWFAISGGFFCELTAPSATNVSLLPLQTYAIDPHSRASVRRAVPLYHVVRCERVSLPNTPFPLQRAPPPITNSTTFRLDTRTRTYFFRAEHPQEAKAWVEGFQLIAERNARGKHGHALRVGMLCVRVYEEGEAEIPISVFLDSTNPSGVLVRELKNRLVERRGLLPSQQHLQTIPTRQCDHMAGPIESGDVEKTADGEIVLLDDDDMSLATLPAETESGDRVLKIRLTSNNLLVGAPCAGPGPGSVNEGSSLLGISSSKDTAANGQEKKLVGLAAYDDIEPMSEKKWRFKLDWQPAVAVDALVVYHKRFPPSRNLVGMVTSSDGTDPWWREVLTQMHVTPQPIRGEAHLTLVLEGSKDTLGAAAERSADMYERPLLYFCPKVGMKRMVIEPALRLGFGAEGQGWATSTDRDGREIWVIKRPPLVTMQVSGDTVSGGSAEKLLRVIYTFIFRNPGKVTLMPVLQCCCKFRVLFQPHGHDCYAKFEVSSSLVNLL